MSAQALGWLMGAAALVALGGSSARAGIIEPELSVAGGSGVPGGTVSVTVSLADDVDDAGVSAGLDLRFGADALEFFGPVEDSCAVAERLSATHGVAGMLLDPDLLNLEVFVLVGPPPPPPLGNGELVTCDFRIRDGVPAGTVALEIEAPILGDAEGTPIPVRVRNGSVEILAAVPTSTPTATGTPRPTDTPEATPTATGTGEVTATATATATNTSPPATSTATATRTGSPVTPPTATATDTPSTPPPTTATATATRTGATPTATRRPGGGGDGGCNVTPVDASTSPGAAALLLLPAVLLWVRRRGR
jgi:MYXO-CTERM domain-containing protein